MQDSAPPVTRQVGHYPNNQCGVNSPTWPFIMWSACTGINIISSPVLLPHFTIILLNSKIAWTGKPGVLPWGGKELDTTERLNWTELKLIVLYLLFQLLLLKWCTHGGFPGGPVVKTLPANAGDMGSVPDLGWSNRLRSHLGMSNSL